MAEVVSVAILAFPSPELTPEDETAIVATLRRGGDYCCRRDTMEGGGPALALLNSRHQLRGHVTKRHGVYAVLDARGYAVLRTRQLAEVLASLVR
jgi:hypothetical protein